MGFFATCGRSASRLCHSYLVPASRRPPGQGHRPYRKKAHKERGPKWGPSQTRESAYKPDSVPIRRSATVIYLGQTSPSASLRPTWEIGRVTRSLLGLAPGGVCLAVPVARHAGGLLHHRFTFACEVMLIAPLRDRNLTPDRRKTVRPHRPSVLCGTFRRFAPPGRYPAPHPVESGLSSTGSEEPTATVRRTRLNRIPGRRR